MVMRTLSPLGWRLRGSASVWQLCSRSLERSKLCGDSYDKSVHSSRQRTWQISPSRSRDVPSRHGGRRKRLLPRWQLLGMRRERRTLAESKPHFGASSSGPLSLACYTNTYADESSSIPR
eukprot:scaffold12646_cov33-Tisochrysis_lutea.AAC.2